jgi:hypothetical protein
MNGLLRGTISVCLTCACAAAAARQWVVIDGNVVGRADSNRYSVVVLAVDGKTAFGAPTTVTVTPGIHHLKLASTRQDGSTIWVPYSLNAEPCTHYSIHAEYESRLERSPWQLVITKDPKPLGGCMPENGPDAGVTSAIAPTPAKPR